MTESQALVPFSLEETMSLGQVMFQSGYFSDTKAQAQAVVKILAGREIGMGPIASMTGVHIVQGKPTIGANLLGAAIKGSGKYDYRVVTLDDTAAEIAFYQNGQEIGRSQFTMDDAKIAGLLGKSVWKQYPRNMLFSRAMSNGARWYCPDVLSGVTPYTPEELGGEVVVDDGGEIVDVMPTVKVEISEPFTHAVQQQESPTPIINTPGELYEYAKKLDYYHSIPHMLNTLKKVAGDDKVSWPTNNPGWYDNALAQLTEYARANQAQDAIKDLADQKEMPF